MIFHWIQPTDKQLQPQHHFLTLGLGLKNLFSSGRIQLSIIRLSTLKFPLYQTGSRRFFWPLMYHSFPLLLMAKDVFFSLFLWKRKVHPLWRVVFSRALENQGVDEPYYPLLFLIPILSFLLLGFYKNQRWCSFNSFHSAFGREGSRSRPIHIITL